MAHTSPCHLGLCLMSRCVKSIEIKNGFSKLKETSLFSSNMYKKFRNYLKPCLMCMGNGFNLQSMAPNATIRFYSCVCHIHKIYKHKYTYHGKHLYGLYKMFSMNGDTTRDRQRSVTAAPTRRA